MRILILWAGDTNANLGVRALARGSRDLLRQAWPDAEFSYADFGQRPPELPWGSIRSLVRERVTGRLGMQRWLRGFDLVWDTRAGDSFSDIYGVDRIGLMSTVHEFAREAGVPVVMAPQTIGPVFSRRGRMIAGRTLRRSSLVFARDPESAIAAEQLGRRVDAVVTDLVFGIDPPPPTAPHDVVVNVSGLLWGSNSHVDHTKYRSAVRSIIGQLVEDGRRVTLLPHVLESSYPDSDVATTAELVTEFGGAIDSHVPTDLDDARSVIASSAVLIGARMHACLNALSTGVPALAMSYSRKFEPLMRSIEWKHVVSLKSSGDPSGEVLDLLGDDTLRAQARHTQQLAADLLAGALPLLRGLR